MGIINLFKKPKESSKKTSIKKAIKDVFPYGNEIIGTYELKAVSVS